MRKLRNTKNILLHTSAVFAIVFLAAIFASSALAPVTSSNAAETKLTANVSYAVHTLSITAASSITLDVNARPSGAMTVAASNINMNTSSPNGYKLYLGMNSNTADLLRNGNEQATRLKAVSGTFADPASMKDTSSTWGYALASASAAEGNGFDGSYTTGEDLTPTTNKFASLPTNNQAPQLVIESEEASAASGDDYNIYYAVNASYDTPTGTYSNQVVYTAIADGGSGHAMTINPSQTSNTAGGDKINVITTLYGTASSFTGTVYMLTADERAAVNNNTPITNYANRALTCTRDTSAETLQYSCTTPANALGTYYVVVDVPEYNERYEKAFSYVEATFWNISTMQQMTPALCASVTTPSASATLTDTTGAFHGNNAYVPQRTLYDVRDANAYTIRKLADGNCWMTENLRKELAENEVLTPATSDVLSDVTVGATTQPYNQASTNYYDWGIGTSGTQTETNTDRWLSRSTKVGSTWSTETTPVQSGAPSANLTGEDQKTGVYYNWYTATAGTGTWSMTTSGTEASSSVCPAGWQLPRHSAVNGTSTLAPSGSWMHLIRDVYGVIKNQGNQSTVADGNLNANNQLHAFPFSLPYSGNVTWQSGGTGNQGASGLFWSAGATSQTTARNLGFSGTDVWPESSSNRLSGFSVRCVANDSTPGTLTVTPDSIDADTTTTVDVSLPLSGDYNANISLGSTALTCSRTSTSPLSFSCSVPSTASGTYTLTASLPSYGKNYTGSLEVVNPVPTTMQTMTADYCANKMNENDTLKLKDTRGDVQQSYTIAKLADENCWMVENLRLGSASSDTVLTPADSNVSANFTIQASAVQTSGETGWDATSVHVYIQSGSDSINNAPYGNLYNWFAATAGTGTSDMANTNATADICPKGWRLPDGGPSTDKSFKSLDIAMGGTGENRKDTAFRDKFRVSPYLFPYPGRYYSGLRSQGINGLWWSRSAYSSSEYAYGFGLYYDGRVYPQDLNDKYYGFSVRCVLQ